jgi:Leucine-rich repeat (LRR) protein
MYETLEHWKQYKQVKKLKNNLKNLKYLELAIAKLELDKFINKLAVENGTTKY